MFVGDVGKVELAVSVVERPLHRRVARRDRFKLCSVRDKGWQGQALLDVGLLDATRATDR